MQSINTADTYGDSELVKQLPGFTSTYATDCVGQALKQNAPICNVW
jgi:hypothetical protein